MDLFPPSPHDSEPQPGDAVGFDVPQPYPYASYDTLGAGYVSSEPPGAADYDDTYHPTGGMGSPPPAPPTIRRPRHRRTWLLIGAAALVLALLVGGGVAFAGSQSSNTPTQAPAATVPSPAKAHKQSLIYVVTQVSGTTITATAPDGSTVTIATGPSTVYMQKGQTATLSSIQPGMRIRVAGKKQNGVIAAKRILIVGSKKNGGGATPTGATPTAAGTLNVPPAVPEM